ncbi:hypothetical protein PAC13_34870 (plasmid) [Pseudomonas aeruginosa]|uniref:hypothetical protein n=1 Tax=Pseudomonas aeruginosa TaxID=287 RepID=UPI00227A8C43|nr:hypothetical protein [Pseudomonas aeruginosa]WAJ88588.1 hypothetical protein PAC13_34870 [Pseudomonas aeruginosa]
MTEQTPTPPSAAEAVALARKQVVEISESRTLSAVQYNYGHALGWIAAMYRAGVLDWPTHEALYQEASAALEQWRQPPQGEAAAFA